MTLQYLIETYGYWAVFIGTFFEGETILVLGGFAANQGYLDLRWVILAAFAGSTLGDQLFFLLGRRHGRAFLARHPSWTPRIERAQKLLDRFHTPLILSFRFMYGLRTVTSFAVGLSSVRTKEFIFLNLAGALIWAFAVGILAFLFGEGLEAVLGDVKKYELEILAGIVAAGAGLWLVLYLRRRST